MFALVNLTTGQVVTPFNSERAAGWERDKFPASDDVRTLKLFPSVEQAVENTPKEG